MGTPVSAGALVTVSGVSFGYDGKPVLLDVDYAVQPAEFTGIVGPSGSGKTSLLKVLLGTVTPQRGTVHRQPGVAVSYVPQLETVNWNFPVTVAECVLMSRSTRRLLPWATPAEKLEVAALLERLGIGELGRRHIRELSGGQQQRMFIARALLRRPRLLLMDEPTSGVDIGTRHEVLHLLGDLNRDGLAIVLTTHDLNGMAAHLPHLVALQRRVIAAGPPSEVIVPDVLEQTFGARMEVLQHLGMPVVVDTGEPVRLQPVAG
ncbi:MAG: putative metal transporter ATP-binding protein [Frankiales bacterium]|jgi:ABC-type Mn2+/Zn2+ transport system ATPase subunit|nr:putative metal transporter ATP-binding protein [Frankiales bacterium]